MARTQTSPDPTRWLSLAALAIGALLLAVHPVVWLVGTWTAPAYDSPGGWVFAAVAALFLWSATSPKLGQSGSTRHAWWLLLGTALVRLAGRLLAINVLGALALAVDVYALGVLAGISERKRAVSPFWLAVLFVFSLPVERIIQRVVGYALQHVSAAGSCSILGLFFDELSCAGVDITLGGQHVLVDLPCSGARGLMLLSTLFAAIAALSRPSARRAVAGLGLALVSALVANSLRIAALAVGIAFPDAVGVDVMAQPWHDLVGLGALAFGLLPLVWWGRGGGRGLLGGALRSGAGAPDHLPPAERRGEEPPARSASGCISNNNLHKLLPALFLIAAVGILLAPQTPVDVARPIGQIALPSTLGGHPADRQPLSAMERDYFTRFGGAAAKASYGPHTLLAVRTSAPLRHMHAPDECLAGAGFDVEPVGVTGRALPGATYLATDPNGRRWRVVVTYVSDAGHVSTNISEVIWRWMQHPGTTWTALERIHPMDHRAQDEAFDAAVARAFELRDSPQRSQRAQRKSQLKQSSVVNPKD